MLHIKAGDIKLSAGPHIYIARLVALEYNKSIKMLLLK
jgi:hypothetical protein